MERTEPADPAEPTEPAKPATAPTPTTAERPNAPDRPRFFHHLYTRHPPLDAPLDIPWLPGIGSLARRILERFPWARPLWNNLRPLDPIRSIKAKFGILVVVSVTFAGSFTAIGVTIGIRARYVVLVAVVLSLIVTQVLAHGMTSPLRRMTAAARAMANGDYTRRIRATTQDEVGELAAAFNQMAADLEAADRQRRELIANVSHELRTPISVLRAVLENVVDGVTEPTDATVTAALTQTERLGRLVEELLDLSRLEAGAIPLDLSRFRVGPFLERVIDEAAGAGRPVRFELAVSPPDLTVQADQARLHQVVANLVDNAAKHSPRDGVVQVSAWARPPREAVARDGGPGPGAGPRTEAPAPESDPESPAGPPCGIRIEVADQGPGIPEAERTKVFERFTRASETGNSSGGTGLGLAIARWAVDLHGGKIEVAPSAAGALIRVDLP
ncbi:MAG TPA: HAMP domain-containing sensor histidine kinase [Actinocrinis sp.]|nr:HAMP domain-containing sensor histidine kinase [Actinocrinis sp.]